MQITIHARMPIPHEFFTRDSELMPHSPVEDHLSFFSRGDEVDARYAVWIERRIKKIPDVIVWYL